MENSSRAIIFFLNGLNDTKSNKLVYFSCSFLIYLFSVFVNLTLLVTVMLDRVLHEPMYIFLCNLCVNGIFGATSFYPKFLLDLLSESHIISYNTCLAQIFLVCIYVFCQFSILTVMAYDRYVAICKPLEYHSIMTPGKVGKLLLVPWLLSLCETLIGYILIARLPLCGFKIDKLYCNNWDVVKLSCIDTSVNNVYGYSVIIAHFIQALLIVISYFHIIRTCVRSKAEQNKFMETCLPHVITLTSFYLFASFDALYARYGSSSSLQGLRNFFSIEYLIIPPLLDPLIYGLKLKQIQRSIRRLLSRKVSAGT
ncbi:putative gustatory receptor clone PTE03 [Brienomyrus brachyistius]|uniref:putative gustatory receptor clone PTE03 n=1 Tax=Brienomyrus brachyistius TaxID=42636 RepID=UPI0020B39A02|nr:putative gustatory receptor clone PTE03 [Brienomyrus brachyistius]XP_048836306.1 putative gustatory receptor clone PTE03 [Brienomyrus brachyistius]